MLVDLNEIHFKEIIAISNKVFGEGFLTNNQLHIYHKNKIKKGFVLLNQNQVIGFITIDFIAPEQLINSLLKDGKLIYDKLSNYTTIGFIKQVIIHPNHQQKGFGKQIIKNVLEQLNYKIDAWLCIAWMQEDVIPIENALLKNHFLKEILIKNYWKDNSVKNKYNCMICGTPPCQCNAVAYLLTK